MQMSSVQKAIGFCLPRIEERQPFAQERNQFLHSCCLWREEFLRRVGSHQQPRSLGSINRWTKRPRDSTINKKGAQASYVMEKKRKLPDVSRLIMPNRPLGKYCIGHVSNSGVLLKENKDNADQIVLPCEVVLCCDKCASKYQDYCRPEKLTHLPGNILHWERCPNAVEHYDELRILSVSSEGVAELGRKKGGKSVKYVVDWPNVGYENWLVKVERPNESHDQSFPPKRELEILVPQRPEVSFGYADISNKIQLLSQMNAFQFARFGLDIPRELLVECGPKNNFLASRNSGLFRAASSFYVASNNESDFNSLVCLETQPEVLYPSDVARCLADVIFAVIARSCPLSRKAASLPPPLLGEYDVVVPVTGGELMLNVAQVDDAVAFESYCRSSDGAIGPAEHNQLVRGVGDRIIAVNGISTIGKPCKDALEILQESCLGEFSYLRFVEAAVFIADKQLTSVGEIGSFLFSHLSRKMKMRRKHWVSERSDMQNALDEICHNHDGPAFITRLKGDAVAATGQIFSDRAFGLLPGPSSDSVTKSVKWDTARDRMNIEVTIDGKETISMVNKSERALIAALKNIIAANRSDKDVIDEAAEVVLYCNESLVDTHTKENLFFVDAVVGNADGDVKTNNTSLLSVHHLDHDAILASGYCLQAECRLLQPEGKCEVAERGISRQGSTYDMPFKPEKSQAVSESSSSPLMTQPNEANFDVVSATSHDIFGLLHNSQQEKSKKSDIFKVKYIGSNAEHLEQESPMQRRPTPTLASWEILRGKNEIELGSPQLIDCSIILLPSTSPNYSNGNHGAMVLNTMLAEKRKTVNKTNEMETCSLTSSGPDNGVKQGRFTPACDKRKTRIRSRVKESTRSLAVTLLDLDIGDSSDEGGDESCAYFLDGVDSTFFNKQKICEIVDESTDENPSALLPVQNADLAALKGKTNSHYFAATMVTAQEPRHLQFKHFRSSLIDYRLPTGKNAAIGCTRDELFSAEEMTPLKSSYFGHSALNLSPVCGTAMRGAARMSRNFESKNRPLPKPSRAAQPLSFLSAEEKITNLGKVKCVSAGDRVEEKAVQNNGHPTSAVVVTLAQRKWLNPNNVRFFSTPELNLLLAQKR